MLEREKHYFISILLEHCTNILPKILRKNKAIFTNLTYVDYYMQSTIPTFKSDSTVRDAWRTAFSFAYFIGEALADGLKFLRLRRPLYFCSHGIKAFPYSFLLRELLNQWMET